MVEAFAPAVGSCALSAILIGFAMAFTIFIALLVLLGTREGVSGAAVLIATGFGIIPPVVLGLLPPWSAIFIGLVAVVVLKDRLSGD